LSTLDAILSNLPDVGTPVVATSTDERLADRRLAFDAAFWSGDHDTEDFLIAPLIAAGRGHSLYAPAKGGKSLFVLYAVACAATGRPVLDHPGGEPVRVVYVDMEMTATDVRERLCDMGFGPDDDLTGLVYYSLPSLPPLDTPLGGAELVELAQHHRADLVVIDTLSRVMAGAENENDTAQNFARFTGTPLKAAGIAALRIDHAGKDIDRGQRGGSAKNDDVDVVWRYTPKDRGRFELKATHKRMSWVPEFVAIEQTTEPLAYRIVSDSWPAGTQGVVDMLNELGVPATAGRQKAAEALKAAGHPTPRTEVMAAAVRFRKMEADRNGTGL
jgi:hypothetical protein